MSTSLYRTRISKLQADIASLRKKMGQEKVNEAKRTSEITKVQRSITKRTSSSSLRSKENKINRLLGEIAKTQKRVADLEKKIASKTKELRSYEIRLSKAETTEGEILAGRPIEEEEDDSDIEEPARESEFPNDIGFRGPEHDKRAWVMGTGLDVWEIIQAYRAMGRERFLEETETPEEALDLALAYYEAHPEEVDRVIAENQRSPEEWGRLYPHVKPASHSA